MLPGRDAEVAATRAATGGTGGGVLLRGPAGIGKTAVLTEALPSTGAGSGARTVQCFRSMSRSPGAALRRAWPQPVPDGDAAWVARYLAKTAPGRHLLLRVEDLQWADLFFLEVLASLPDSAVVAATLRDGDPGVAAAERVAERRGLRIVVLGPLDEESATAVVRAHHRQLREPEARDIARRCGGNPLLLTHLGSRDAADAGLQRTLVARLRALGPEAWDGFAAVALAETPLPRQWVPAANTLAAAGAVISVPAPPGAARGGRELTDDERVAAPHRLLAEAVLAELQAQGGADERRILAALADRAEQSGLPALAARWAARSGQRARAARLALDASHASDAPGQRADLLALAASCSDGPERAELTTAAVDVLVSTGSYDRAAELIDAAGADPSPHWAGLVGRVRWQQGDTEAARAAYERGLEVAAPGSPDEVLLRAELARLVTLAHGDAEEGVRLARLAVAAASEAGAHQARALAVLGTAENFVGSDEDARHLRAAIDLARADGDVMVEFTSANNLIAVLESSGRAGEAAQLARHFAERAELLHLRSWYQQMTAMELNARMHGGDYDPVLVQAPELLAEGLDTRTRDQLEATFGLVCADLGRRDGADRLERSAGRAGDDWSRGNALFVLAECRLWSGEAAAAIDAATRAIDLLPDNGVQLFPLLTRAHARRELGEPVPARPWTEPYAPILTAAPLELDALAAASDGDRKSAAARFASAADRWAGHHVRGELRCRWLAAEYAADDETAVAALVPLADHLAQLGWQPLLERVRRSLRDRGVRSFAPRGRRGGLTQREREVLALVADGLGTEAIAARLQLAPSTVTALIASARGRSGAASRWQAASDA